jgi:predicted transcriptional regulator
MSEEKDRLGIAIKTMIENGLLDDAVILRAKKLNIETGILLGNYDNAVIARAIELIKSGDMDIDFMCDVCERGNCDDCQREPQYDESRE